MAARTPNTDLALKHLESERYLEEGSARLHSWLDDSHGVHSARGKFGVTRLRPSLQQKSLNEVTL